MTPLAWDTETARFGPGMMAPPLSCISWMQEGDVGLLGHKDGVAWLRAKLQDPHTLHVGHHIAYDMAVAAAEDPSLIPLIFRAYRENRVTDTMLRQMLLDNAMGKFRGFWLRTVDGDGHYHERFVKLYYSLDACYHRVTKKHLDKDTYRLHYGELRGVPIDMWPMGAREYPLMDGRATMAVFEWQEKLCEQIKGAYAATQTHIESPDPLADQFAQARAAWWIQLMSVWGIRTEPDRVDAVEADVQERLAELRELLQPTGLVRSNGSRNTKAAQARMLAVMGGKDNCKLTEKQNIQLDEDACNDSGDPILKAYARISSLGNVLSKDLKALRRGKVLPIHSKFNSFMATGRTSSSDPNLQNIRRLKGLRECFVPRPGKVFLDADYDGLELRTLAQTCIELVGYSKLGEALNAGDDPHLRVAAQMLGISYEEAKERHDAGDEEVDDARQLGKVANFGFPGGLGYETLVEFAKGYGVTIDVEAAKKLKETWVKAFPEMERYFQIISGYGQTDPEDPDWVLHSIEQLYTKRLRGDCTYTAACNSYFQGLGADATKAAGFLIAYECYVDTTSPLFGCRIVNYIHDQFILECDEDKAHDAAYRLADLMVKGAAPFLPDVPATVSKPVVCRFWSKKAKQVFDEKGRLIPWEAEFEIAQRGD